MQNVSSEDMVGGKRSEREAKELKCGAEDRSRDLLSKREMRWATAIVVLIGCLRMLPRGAVRDKRLKRLSSPRTSQGYETATRLRLHCWYVDR